MMETEKDETRNKLSDRYNELYEQWIDELHKTKTEVDAKYTKLFKILYNDCGEILGHEFIEFQNGFKFMKECLVCGLINE